ncbi:MAG: GNAT family N-acetyltransferase [Vicinamibacteria bacterium]
MIEADGIRVLEPEEWTRELSRAGIPFRFSQRADAVIAFERAFPEYDGRLFEVSYSDGARALFPGVIARRGLAALSSFLGMPLGLEGTPIPLHGQLTAQHVSQFFRSIAGIGALRITGGAGGSPPPLGRVRASSTHVLDLTPGFEALWQRRFSGKNRNACRKAEKHGVTVTRQASPEGAELYYDLYVRATRAWGYAKAPYPKALFQALAASAHVEFWLAVRQNAVISGAILLLGSEDALYWSGAMDRECADISPSNLVLRVAIESACRRGLRSMDFGASEGLPGVQRFKESFGATPRPFQSIGLATPGNRVAEAITAVLRRAR